MSATLKDMLRSPVSDESRRQLNASRLAGIPGGQPLMTLGRG